MSTLLAPRRPAPLLGDDGEPTLDELLAATWRDLDARSVAPCPVCGSEIRASSAAVPARCGACQSELS